MPEHIVLLSDQQQIAVPEGTTFAAALKQLNPALYGRTLAVQVGEQKYDLAAEVPAGSHRIVPLDFDSAAGRSIFWHSTAHLMAAAVKELYPETRVAIGPAIQEGFYYDFDREQAFTPEDLHRIEARMQEIRERKEPFRRQIVTMAEAREMFGRQGENYKLELLEGIQQDAVSLYRLGDFVDLCRGPHVPHAGMLKAFKLLSIAGAYWRGDEHNKMLQRIYGVSFDRAGALEEHLRKLEEAKRRDHRRLGKDLDLFSLHEDAGAGLVYWHPKGALIRKQIEDFWEAEHLRNGYELLNTPHIGKAALWETSGHLSFYKDYMYSPMQIDQESYYIKPMNCPFHIQIYQTRMRSYRQMPIRWAELGTVYRYEKSGVLHGLFRVRGFTQDDAHIFCRRDQLEGEITEVIRFVLFVLKTFGFQDYEVFLSTQPKEGSVGGNEVWQEATSALQKALEACGLPYGVDEGGGAFYGPKVDIKIGDCLGRMYQCSTIQVDFNNPERFDVNYIGEDGQEHRAIMIHRALMGSLERFFGILIEHYGGAFPVWLAPVQARICTITDKQQEYAQKMLEILRKSGIRADADLRSEKINAKIRDAQLEKIPYMLVLGDREMENQTASLRLRTGENRGPMPINEIIGIVHERDQTKSQEL